MILKKEIEIRAEEQGMPKSTIDKDWVLGHFIDAIYSIPECRQHLVFKGGTCLRKCYFPDYRFSEDLDFTATDQDFKLDKEVISTITNLITERTEVPLHLQELAPLRSDDRLTGYRATIKFWGADHPRNQLPPPPERWTSSVKIEIILYEQLIFESVEKQVFHPYPDKLSADPLTVPCYGIHEVLAEKLRSLIQRSYTAPRDLYDIWYLANNFDEIDWESVIAAFHEKMRFKGLTFTGIDQMINDENDKRLKAAWKNSLGHQIPKVKLPEYELVKDSIQKLLTKIITP